MFGSYGDASAIPPLIRDLDDAELTVAALTAPRHLSVDLHDSRIGDAMVRLLEQPNDYSVITEAIGILEELKDARVASVSLRLLDQAAEMPLSTSQTVDRTGISQADLAAGDAAQWSMLCFTCAVRVRQIFDECDRRTCSPLDAHEPADSRSGDGRLARRSESWSASRAVFDAPARRWRPGRPATSNHDASLPGPSSSPDGRIFPKRLAEFEKVSLELQRRIERQAAQRKRRF